MTTWKTVPNYSDYLVSDEGTVRSLMRGGDRLLKPSKRVKGYLQISLRRGGKQTSPKVHQLVLLAFVGPRPDGMVSRHLNGIPSDNRLENLTYGTQKENIADKDIHGSNYQANKTHCPQGHPYNLENTHARKNIGGWSERRCRACGRIYARNKRRAISNE